MAPGATSTRSDFLTLAATAPAALPSTEMTKQTAYQLETILLVGYTGQVP